MYNSNVMYNITLLYSSTVLYNLYTLNTITVLNAKKFTTLLSSMVKFSARYGSVKQCNNLCSVQCTVYSEQ